MFGIFSNCSIQAVPLLLVSLVKVKDMIRACAQCGTKNRIPARHLSDSGRCGSCKAVLPPVGEPINADSSLFAEIVQEAKVPVLVDFWAAWCGPCKMAAPEVQAVAQEVAGRALVLKVDTEAYPDVAAQFRVQSIPNFVVLRNGKTILQQAGLVRRDQMRSWLDRASTAGAQ